MSRVHVLGFALLLGLPACRPADLSADAGAGGGADVAPDRAADRDAGTTPDLFGCTPISESARAGCRASDEPNCDRCCLQTTPDICTLMHIPCSSALAGVSIAGYCGASSLPGPCPADCLPCASCTKWDEAMICNLMPTIGACDCANVDPGIDPCIAPQSCGCLCTGYLGALRACPP